MIFSSILTKPYCSRTSLVHDVTGKELLYNHTSKMYVYWYEGPQSMNFNLKQEEDLCGSAYFGIQPKYENIYEDSCFHLKCVACEITNMFERTITLNLRGLCKETYFDSQYAIKYDPINFISYVGISRSIITYDFSEETWNLQV